MQVCTVSLRFEFQHHQDAAQCFFERAELPRPAGASTQWLSFRFRSEDMQRHSPASHFAIVLRARLGRDAAGVPNSISGRGVAWGDTSLAQPLPGNPHAHAPGFGGAPGAVIESFWPGGNFLHRQARLLDEGLRDGVDYTVHVHVNDQRHIAFWIAAVDGVPPQASLLAEVQDEVAHPVLDGPTGIVIALGRGPVERGPWSACFEDIRFGWF